MERITIKDLILYLEIYNSRHKFVIVQGNVLLGGSMEKLSTWDIILQDVVSWTDFEYWYDPKPYTILNNFLSKNLVVGEPINVHTGFTNKTVTFVLKGDE